MKQSVFCNLVSLTTNVNLEYTDEVTALTPYYLYRV